MKTILFVLLFTATLAFGKAGDYTLTDDLTVVIEDPMGNKIVAGQIKHNLKVAPVKVQSAVNAKLAAQADAAPMATRALIGWAKVQGATVEAVTEAKVVAAEVAAAEAVAAEDILEEP